VFVEDTAVVLPELAILTSPGAESRAGEVTEMARALAPFRRILRVEPPATIDGGDVLVIGATVCVGETTRTNRAGVEALRALVEPHGYTVVTLRVDNCLHLKTGCTAVGTGLLLVNPDLVDMGAFTGVEVLHVAPGEHYAGNALSIGSTTFVPRSAPRTGDLLSSRGRDVRFVDISELEKAEAGLTCMSIVFDE
jgi:dimethylargininase